MKAEMRIHYVAFLDILGFKSFVDKETKLKTGEYLEKLLRCHDKAISIFRKDPNLSIIQFSDSIVISRPYVASEFKSFIITIAKYQRLLLDEELLCRGGVAVNQHYTTGTFTFSAGLIDAYKVESETARYPRIVISPDVIDLVYPDNKTPTELVQEDDDLFFIDYIGITKKQKTEQLKTSIHNVVTSLKSSPSSSVREKGIWLANYSDALLNTTLTPPKFRAKRTH